METYRKMRQRHQAEANALPLMFAFSSKQFDEGMRKLGLEPDQTDQIYKLGNTGGFYKKSDSELIFNTFDKHEKEQQEAMQNDDFVQSMFEYELANHEWQISHDDEEVLDACGLSENELDERLAQIWEKAKSVFWKKCIKNDWF